MPVLLAIYKRFRPGRIDCGNNFGWAQRLLSMHLRMRPLISLRSIPLPARNVGQVNVGSQLWHIVRVRETDI